MTVFVKLSNFQKRFSIFSKTILVSFDIAPSLIRHSPYSTLPLIKKAVTNYHGLKYSQKTIIFLILRLIFN